MIPNIIWKGSPNYGLPRGTMGRGSHRVLALVDHIMAGTLAGTDAWFNNRDSGASAHFGVGRYGQIHQYVDIENAAWHAGTVKNPSWPLLIPDVNPNLYTIGIEHEGQSGDVLSEAQYQATLALHRWLIGQFTLIPGPDTIIGHYRIDGINKARCPGPGFPWKRLLADLAKEEAAAVEKVRVVENAIYYEAFRYNGKTFVELRSYAAQDGKLVSWDEAARTATVTGGKLAQIRAILEH